MPAGSELFAGSRPGSRRRIQERKFHRNGFSARRTAALDRVGFNQRKRSGSGYYLGPEQLSKVNAFRLSDILRRVPGLRVNYSGGLNEDVVTSSRGGSLSGEGCVQYYVDDVPWMAAFPGGAIFLTVFAYNLIGESLRDAIDPYLKKTAS